MMLSVAVIRNLLQRAKAAYDAHYCPFVAAQVALTGAYLAWLEHGGMSVDAMAAQFYRIMRSTEGARHEADT